MILAGLDIPLWVVLSILAVWLSYLYMTWTYDTFKKTNIPGPKPWPLVGTFPDMYNKSCVELDMEYRQKYGKFVGTFDGRRPVLIVSDPDFLKDVLVKHFDVFTNRRPMRTGSTFDLGVNQLHDDHWKFIRGQLSPTFTSGKLKQMLPAIDNCASKFIKNMEAVVGQDVDIRLRTHAFTMDVIATTAFGLDVDSQRDPDCAFMKNANRLNGDIINTDTFWAKVKHFVVVFIFVMAPDWFISLLVDVFGMTFFGKDVVDYFESICEKTLEDRRNHRQGHDFVQSLADSIISQKGKAVLKDDLGFKWSREGLTKQEVIGNAMIFLSAGGSTTSDTLQMLIFELTLNPKIQEQAYQEVSRICTTEEITLEQLQQLQYVDWCLDEVLRLYPAGFRYDRTASQDITIQGVDIKKGTIVIIPVYVLHRDPELWEEPELFDPERFSTDRSAGRHPLAYTPFGYGNRSCIGSRLALLEMKVFIVKTLKKFRLLPGENMQRKPLQLKAGLSMLPKDPIRVKVALRD